jgi:hypothetical protein
LENGWTPKRVTVNAAAPVRRGVAGPLKLVGGTDAA